MIVMKQGSKLGNLSLHGFWIIFTALRCGYAAACKSVFGFKLDGVKICLSSVPNEGHRLVARSRDRYVTFLAAEINKAARYLLTTGLQHRNRLRLSHFNPTSQPNRTASTPKNIKDGTVCCISTRFTRSICSQTSAQSVTGSHSYKFTCIGLRML
jgi:hypothetical protein